MARFVRLAAVAMCALLAVGTGSVAGAGASPGDSADLSGVTIRLTDLPDGYRAVAPSELEQSGIANAFEGTVNSGIFASADSSEVLFFGFGEVPPEARREVAAGLADPEKLIDLPWSASQTSTRDSHRLDTSGIGQVAGGASLVDVAAENVAFRNALGFEGTRAGTFMAFGLRGSYLFGAVVMHIGAGSPQVDAVAMARLVDVRLAAALGISTGGTFRPEGTFSPEVATNIPSPADVSTEPKVVAANLVLAALAFLALTIGMRMLNTTLVAHEDALERLIRPARVLRGWWSKVDAAVARRRGHVAEVVRTGGVLAFYGVLFSFLEPGWRPWTLAGLFVLVVMTIAFGVVGTCDDMVELRSARRWGLPARLAVKPALVLFALGSVALTKLAGLVPGLLIGTPEAFSIEDEVSERDETRLAGVGLGVTAAIGLGAWALSAPLDGRLSGGSGAGQKVLGGLVSLLVLIFAVAVENLFANLLAFPGSEGAAIRRRSAVGWGVMMLAVTALFFHTLINPRGDLAESLRSTNVRVILITVGVFLLATAVIRLVFRRRDRGLGAQPVGTAPTAEVEVPEPVGAAPMAEAEVPEPVEPVPSQPAVEEHPLPPPAPVPAPPMSMPMPLAPPRLSRRAVRIERPRQRHTARTVRRSITLVVLLSLIGAVAVVVFQHRRDTDRYHLAHTAYLAGRCDDAVADFDILLGSSRWIDTSGTLGKAEAERNECADLLAVDALADPDPPAALAGYATFLTSWPDTPLRELVASRAAGLVTERGAAGVASIATCSRLTEISSAGVIAPAAATAIKLECAVLYDGAGREADAYQAALEVLRAGGDQQLVDRAASLLLAKKQVCADFDEIRTLVGLDQRPADLSTVLQSCITTASDSGDLAGAAAFQLTLLSALPADPAAPAAEAALLERPEACSVLGDAQADPVVAARDGFLAGFTFRCAQVAEYTGEIDAAIERYQWFLDHAPLDERATSARDGLARALIKQAESTGAGELPEPSPSGGSGTAITRVVVYNDSPEELRLVISGPESRIEVIPASPTSSTYSLVGPAVCRTDVPSLELDLQPGDYQALVESTSGGVNPFVGTWTLTAGDAYRSCFFIVTSFGSS